MLSTNYSAFTVTDGLKGPQTDSGTVPLLEHYILYLFSKKASLNQWLLLCRQNVLLLVLEKNDVFAGHFFSLWLLQEIVLKLSFLHTVSI